MKKIILASFRNTSKLLYNILGPEKSTTLSQSSFGKFIFSILIGNKEEGIFSGLDGVRLKLSRSEALSSGFFHLGVINPHETNILKKVLRNGDVFIDIGAYVDGWHSIIASKLVGEKGKVYTFEPVPEYYKKLSKNIKLNNGKNVVIEKLAVSNNNGKQTFYIGGLASTLYKEHLPGENDIKGKVTVTTVSLDAYITQNNIKNISLIKIDVEGAELDVIKGGRKTLKAKNSPDLMIEVSDVYLKHGNTSEDELLTLLKKFGYKAYSIKENGLGKYIKKSKGRELMNVYFSKRPQKMLPIV
jgi:FkbM family methyltransferase